MAFTVETGAGLADSNSFTSVEYADVYFADRLNEDWSKLSVNAKQAALLRATAYVCGQYDFKGVRLTSSQALCFPRKGVTDQNGNVPKGIPECVKIVTCELAVRASKGPLIQDPTIDEGGRLVKMKQLRAGPLHKTVEYAGPGEIIEMSRYPAVDQLMCPWLLKTPLVFDHGVKVTQANVQGTNNSKMLNILENDNRYTGPMNENEKDVVKTDVGIV